MTNSSCYDCRYRGKVPGDSHSRCNYPGNETSLFDLFSSANRENAKNLNIRANPRGVQRGWFMWPVNFDPAWLINCDGFKRKEDAT